MGWIEAKEGVEFGRSIAVSGVTTRTVLLLLGVTLALDSLPGSS